MKPSVRGRNLAGGVSSGGVRQARQRDPLTGLYDRRAFNETLDDLIANRRSFGLILFDVDHFKDVNDTLGHDAGDALLVEIASRVTGVLRCTDVFCRIGGDEFAVVVKPAISPNELLSMSQAIYAALSEDFDYEGRTLDCQLSMGGSLFPTSANDRVELLKQADMALYAAKDNGRNRFELFRSIM